MTDPATLTRIRDTRARTYRRRLAATDTSWMVDAECARRGIPTGDYFGLGRTPGRAVAACRACPVSDLCLEYALATGQTHGIWGGAGQAELGEIGRARRRAARNRAQDRRVVS